MNIDRLKLFFEPIRSAPWRAFFTAFHAVSVNTLSLLLIEVSRRLINSIEAGKSEQGLYFYGGIFLAITLVILAIHLIMNFWNSWHQHLGPMRKYMYEKYMRKYLLLNNEDVAKYGVGRMIPLIQRGVEQWMHNLDSIFRNWAWIIVGYISGILYIGFIDARLAGISIVFTLFIGGIIHFLNIGALRWRKFRREYEDKITRQLVIMIMEKFTILKSNKLLVEVKKLGDLSDKRGFYGYKTDIFIDPLGFLPEFCIQILKLSMIVLIGVYVIQGKSTIGDITAILLVTGILSTYITRGATAYKEFTDGQIRVEALWDTFEQIPSIVGYDTGEEFIYQKGNIVLANIKYGYNAEHQVWDNFSLSIEGGKKIALIGRSGVGKSTLIKLILGFVRPESGSINIDGQDLAGVSLASYYKYIGYLSQEPAVFDGTVHENLVYGLKESEPLSVEKMNIALELAQCDFVHMLPQGLETEIGEKGVRLSGGERQRLAIARLFLQEPHIIVLDEPTSALDSYSEAKIAEALHVLGESKTMITIAHRLQTVKDADEIIVLGENMILERGRHEELLAKNGAYAGMVDLQSGRIREE